MYCWQTDSVSVFLLFEDATLRPRCAHLAENFFISLSAEACALRAMASATDQATSRATVTTGQAPLAGEDELADRCDPCIKNADIRRIVQRGFPTYSATKCPECGRGCGEGYPMPPPCPHKILCERCSEALCRRAQTDGDGELTRDALCPHC